MKVLHFAIAMLVILILVLQVRMLQRMERLEKAPAPARVAGVTPPGPVTSSFREAMPPSSPAIEVSMSEEAPPPVSGALVKSLTARKASAMFRSFTPSQQLADLLAERNRAQTYAEDLERISELRGEVDEETYVQLLAEATCTHLDIPDSRRQEFAAALHQASVTVHRLYEDFEKRVQAIGPAPAEKENQGPWREQYDALYRSFVATVAQSATPLGGFIDTTNPRQSEFAQKFGEWGMSYLY